MLRPLYLLVAALLSAALLIAAGTAISPPAHAADHDCSDFSNQAEAQRFFIDQGGPESDPHGLDGDHDGVACETRPCPCSDSQGGGTPQPRRAKLIRARITSVTDGDTIRVRALTGRRRRYRVRLIGIDTPETKRPGAPVECGGREATSSMLALSFTSPRDTDGDGLFDQEGGRGHQVKLATDPTQDTYDRYRRLLAYARLRNGRQLNRSQVARGWARVYVYRGKPFRQVRAFRWSQRSAREAGRGVWGRCGGNLHRSGG